MLCVDETSVGCVVGCGVGCSVRIAGSGILLFLSEQNQPVDFMFKISVLPNLVILLERFRISTIILSSKVGSVSS